MSALLGALADWPLAASLALVATAQGLRAGRRRAALNEALHELRRPLQAAALGAGGGGGAGVGGAVALAADAVERLDREINGGRCRPAREPVAIWPLLAAAVERWRPGATRGGASLAIGPRAVPAVVEGDRLGLAQAIDNLIVNAIEHGGREIVVGAREAGGRVSVAVADSGGTETRPGGGRWLEPRPLPVRSGRGHGLDVVRRTAAAHGGRFALRPEEGGSVAVIELPLSGERTA